jgi:hypothetical protein
MLLALKQLLWQGGLRVGITVVTALWGRRYRLW